MVLLFVCFKCRGSGTVLVLNMSVAGLFIMEKSVTRSNSNSGEPQVNGDVSSDLALPANL